MAYLVEIITAQQADKRDQSIESFCENSSTQTLIEECEALEQFRISSSNLYEKVRALFFLYAIHRFYIPFRKETTTEGLIPYEAYEHILQRRFEDAILILLRIQKNNGPNEGISSALADAYHKLGFQTLANQVKISVRTTAGNNWMFRMGHPIDHPLRFDSRLTRKDPKTGLFPVIAETTPVRMDLSHSCWSDIFFLGMDYPEGAKVLNISVNLCISGTQNKPTPPIETYLRVIEEPVIRLTSTDLEASADIKQIAEVFDFAKDYLGLLKAALIASGIVPPGLEGIQMPVGSLLENMVGPGLGIEIVSQVNNIPKGSRLAVSTNLLASLISLCLRATGQVNNIDGALEENERRLVAAKAILGEWLGGSGGGWQDSGGVWPGIKIISGAKAKENDPEFGISKGQLLPTHKILTEEDVSSETRKKLQDSLVVVHGGMAQDVGPILEMVTEKYLLRSPKEWQARKNAIKYFNHVVKELKNGDIQKIGAFTQQNFEGPIQDIIPWASNAFTEKLIRKTREKYNDQFWGFWMMGGMSGGGMGFIFDPKIKTEAKAWLLETMKNLKKQLQESLPFAMDPVVYDFKINENGTFGNLKIGEDALLPNEYYTLILPALLKKEISELTDSQRDELRILSDSYKKNKEYTGFITNLFERIIPQEEVTGEEGKKLPDLLNENGFDKEFHEEIKSKLKAGRIGLAQNRLPVNSKISDPQKQEIINLSEVIEQNREIGEKAIRNNELAIVTLAGGVGSRWTKGAGVVKSLHPFIKFSGIHRNFLDIQLAKNRKIATGFGAKIPHVFTTSYLTHDPITEYINQLDLNESVYLSKGRFIGQRLYPTERDLRFYWDEMPQQLLDEQAQKMQDSLHHALINWAKSNGEGDDYTANKPQQCIHPVGHWFEIPNMLLNGTLQKMLEDNPGLNYLLVHNIDTLGANADPEVLGAHIQNGFDLSAEVIPRWLDDRGGGLAKINGKVRLIEGMALPNEKIEFNLTYYNSNTFWLSIDPLLNAFGINRTNLNQPDKVKDAIISMAQLMPAYITLKEVKKRWGKGQEDIYPVAQFEKLWGDMTSLDNLNTGFFEVKRSRGQQLKEVAQLDAWLKDGSADYIQSICKWD